MLGTDVAKLRAQSPVYNAQNIKAPVLLIHGKADGRADYEHAQRMKAALEKNKKKVEWLALGPRRSRRLRRGDAPRSVRADPAVPRREPQDAAVNGVAVALRPETP